MWQKYNQDKDVWQNNHLAFGYNAFLVPIGINAYQKKAWDTLEWRKIPVQIERIPSETTIVYGA